MVSFSYLNVDCKLKSHTCLVLVLKLWQCDISLIQLLGKCDTVNSSPVTGLALSEFNFRDTLLRILVYKTQSDYNHLKQAHY